MAMATANLMEELGRAAADAGIDVLGVASAEPFELREEWHHDQPRDLLATARSVVVAGFCTFYEPRVMPSEQGNPRGRFGAYGVRVFEQMERHCMDVVGGYLRGRGFMAVDAPEIAIKPAVVRSGLGRYGKNAVTISPELGSFVMYACVVTDAPLAAQEAHLPAENVEEACGKDCRLCIDACPTGALNGEYGIDRSRCITNWLWGAFAPAELREKQQDRLFGCAECLLACPRNAGVAPRAAYPVPVDTVHDSPELLPIASGDMDYYSRSVPTFSKRAGFDVMRGSAIIALGNAADPAATAVLGSTLRSGSATHRAYSAWALGRIGGGDARALLAAARAAETDAGVTAEIDAALVPG
jgi:epoxyqueuosine reductase